jgi:hypothetical protein
MTDQQVIELIEKEFKEKTLAVTEQHLEIHSPIYSDNKIKVDRIDRESKCDNQDELIIAYLPVLDEKFYFAVYINATKNEVLGVDTEAYHRVYFRATSGALSIDELRSMTCLKPTEFWNKGDLRKYGNSTYTFSSFVILPNPEPHAFEDKLKKLFDVLEQDKDGIKRLVDNAHGYIQVAMDIHNGNGMIGGPHLDEDDIKRMSNMGLSINFDLYVGGNSFKD